MKKILLSTILTFALSSTAHSDTYDPVTNRLSIPSITVDGVVYTDVVITVGEIISIGGSSNQNEPEKQRTCIWNFNGNSDFDKIKYELTVMPDAGGIRAALTGLTNLAAFYPIYVNLVQGSSSVNLQINQNYNINLYQL